MSYSVQALAFLPLHQFQPVLVWSVNFLQFLVSFGLAARRLVLAGESVTYKLFIERRGCHVPVCVVFVTAVRLEFDWLYVGRLFNFQIHAELFEAVHLLVECFFTVLLLHMHGLVPWLVKGIWH